MVSDVGTSILMRQVSGCDSIDPSVRRTVGILFSRTGEPIIHRGVSIYKKSLIIVPCVFSVRNTREDRRRDLKGKTLTFKTKKIQKLKIQRGPRVLVKTSTRSFSIVKRWCHPYQIYYEGRIPNGLRSIRHRNGLSM